VTPATTARVCTKIILGDTSGTAYQYPPNPTAQESQLGNIWVAASRALAASTLLDSLGLAGPPPLALCARRVTLRGLATCTLSGDLATGTLDALVNDLCPVCPVPSMTQSCA
jgi:hypothetical protein